MPYLYFFGFFLFAISFPGIHACPGIHQSSTVFPNFYRFALVCLSFRTFGLVEIRFWSASRQLHDSVNIENFFPFVADIVYRTRCIAYVSAVNTELNFVCIFGFWLRTEWEYFHLHIGLHVFGWWIWKLDFLVNISLCSNNLGSIYLFLSKAVSRLSSSLLRAELYTMHP